MTHIREPRAIGNHADMGAYTAKQQDHVGDSLTNLTATEGHLAGRRHGSRRRVGSDAESPQESQGGATTPDEPDGGGRR